MTGTVPVRTKDLADHFLASGKYTFTLAQAQAVLGVDDPSAVYTGLSRLRSRHEVFSPAQGLYVAVPPEFRNRGVVPAEWFIDAMMSHLGRPYYVSLLTAAAMHGASHQAPQLFQVITDHSYLVRRRDFGQLRLRFYSSMNVAVDPTIQITVPSGYVVVATKETTVVDIVGKPRASGGLSNVATILREIGDLKGSDLARVASRRGRAIARRVGWLVERFGHIDDAEALRQAARLDLGEPVLLDPSKGRRGKSDPTWQIRQNTVVESDL
jgi:predicted transcriptional regulator of viral defense system